eukprot:11232520-Alexandrium_andersonii.AAC.1
MGGRKRARRARLVAGLSVPSRGTLGLAGPLWGALSHLPPPERSAWGLSWKGAGLSGWVGSAARYLPGPRAGPLRGLTA